jgi:transposase
MLVECPSCGCRFKTKTSAGRPRKNIITQNIMSDLQQTLSLKKTAENFKCGTETIKRRLAYIGIKPSMITGKKIKGVK